MKQCRKCGSTLPIDEFYTHPEMADGHLNFCKTCVRQRVNARYDRERGKIATYERERFKDPHRKAKIAEYARERRKRHPEKTRAYNMVTRAIKNGTLKRLPCEVCSDPNSQAHYEDYFRPLDVRWFCFRHHREVGHHQVVNP